MTKPSPLKPAPRAPLCSPSTVTKPPAEPPAQCAIPIRKPTGPVTYTLEKGANVWPGRK
jgi:hypothetical protein